MEELIGIYIQKYLGQSTPEVATALCFIYLGVLYFLKPEHAKRIEPLGKLLRFLASTKGGTSPKKGK